MTPRVSHAQNGEDIRAWRAFHGPASRVSPGTRLTYLDIGANEPRDLSVTAALHDLGWRGVLVEADPLLAAELRALRPGDTVVEAAAAAGEGTLTFHRVPGTGLGTLNAAEAEAARERGFAVEAVSVRALPADRICEEAGLTEIHLCTIDVEGAEAEVLAGMALEQWRPWVLCIEAIEPGTDAPTHGAWEPRLLERGYELAAFDGVNRWYVAREHAELAPAIAVPPHSLDTGRDGWVTVDSAERRNLERRALLRRAWQRNLLLEERAHEPDRRDLEQRIAELSGALAAVEGSRSWRWSRHAARAAKALLGRARRGVDAMPAPLRRRLVRERHLRIVRANLASLTQPGYLERRHAVGDPLEPARWGSDLPFPIPQSAITLGALTDEARDEARAWLDLPKDDDVSLEARMDNRDDEVHRVERALRVRLALAGRERSPAWAGGDRVLVDARSLQSPAFAGRGIGRYAEAAVRAARAAVGDRRVTLLVDPGLLPLPADLAGECPTIARITEEHVAAYSVLIEPSPMTHTPLPLIPLLRSTATRIAAVLDFIPAHVPSAYLELAGDRAEYAAALDALRTYDAFVCDSHDTLRELASVVGRPLEGPGAIDAVVGWPDAVSDAPPMPAGHVVDPSGPIVVMTGDEGRKNTFGALAAIGAATTDDPAREVVVLGMAGQPDLVHHWSIAAAMRPGEAVTSERLTDEAMTGLLSRASLVVVASFDEGLSLPVIEAVRAGAPVVTSRIPAHAELVGRRGSAPAGDLRALARQVRRSRGSTALWRAQARRLARHDHVAAEPAFRALVERSVREATVALPSAGEVRGRTPRVAMATPWAPQRSGVADFSTATGIALARLCDLTVLTTADGNVATTLPEGVRIRQEPLASAARVPIDADALVSVVGNSHFHLPQFQLLEEHEATVISHDTRFTEFYAALRGRGGVEQLMLRTAQDPAPTRIRPPFEDQLEDMRLLQNAAFWEVAHRARQVIVHTPTAVPRIAEETGITPHVLPFANYRAPKEPITAAMREQARRALGFDAFPDGTVHLASFGYVDLRTKLSDVIVEAAGWLTAWGHRVNLVLVGSAPEPIREHLERRAAQLRLAGFRITGYAGDAEFRDHLLAVDLGIQLRVGPLMGVAGGLSDLAAHGTPGLGSRGVCADVDTPAFIDRLPDETSPVMLAEAIERRLTEPLDAAGIEAMRLDYLDRKSPERYAALLLDLLMAAP